MIVREARADELEAIEAIEKSAARRFLGTDAAFIAALPPTPRESLERGLTDGLLWVAEDGGVLIGFILGVALGASLHIAEVDVALEAQGCGVGRRLVEKLAEIARRQGCSALTLTTDRDVPWNRLLYERLGFVLVDAGIPDELRGILDAEAHAGLIAHRRCAMQLDLTPTVIPGLTRNPS